MCKKGTRINRKITRFGLILTVGIVGAGSWPMISYAGWIQSESGSWSYEMENGEKAVGWLRDADGGWYQMGTDGVMLSSCWFQDVDETWYYLNMDGRMLSGQWYQDWDARWYYLNQNGAMLRGCMTPDGYTVGMDGAWDGEMRKRSNIGRGDSGGGSSGGGKSSGNSAESSVGSSEDEAGDGPGDSGSDYDSGDEADDGGVGDSSSDSEEDDQTNLEALQKAMNILFSWYDLAAQAESRITKEAPEHIPDGRFLVTNRVENDARLMTIAGQILDLNDSNVSSEEDLCWEIYIVGKNMVPNGAVLKTIFRDDIQYSHLNLDAVEVEEDIYYVSKFIIVRTSGSITEDKKNTDEYRWKEGDTVTREIDGKNYEFSCIDENYTGGELALFLCNSVIPADWKSSYVPEQGEDGVYEYQYLAGPIVHFGDTSDYKYSDIRSWLKENEDDCSDAERINLGVTYAYTGRTEDGMYSQLEDSDLISSYIGSQKMMDQLWILSLEEALIYREHLWCFEGENEENPDTQIGEFSKGYWLRTPAASGRDEGSEMVYIVDLVNGSLRPESIMPKQEDSADEECLDTAAVGVRPAFVLKQNGF